MKVFLTGGTGLIGRSVVSALTRRRDEVVCVTRRAAPARALWPAGVEIVAADPARPGAWQDLAARCDAIVNLAGEPLAGGRWTAERKRRLRRSRIETTRNVAAAASGARVLVSASATGYYGDGGERALDEASEAGHDFLARLAGEWEAAAREAEGRGCRVVRLRTGIVLARDGGALPRLRQAYKLGLGGPLGGGRQRFPWIHLEDVTRIVLYALDTGDLAGPVNVVAPDPPTQGQFARALGRAVGRPARLPVPAAILRLSLGELAGALLAGQRAVPQALRARGFMFAYPDLETALAELCR